MKSSNTFLKLKPSIGFNLKIAFFLVLTLGSFSLERRQAKAFNASMLNPLVFQCLRVKEEVPCRKALVILEDLQRKALESENYSCQTYALGLGSDLIMSQFKVNRMKSGSELLAQIEMICTTP